VRAGITTTAYLYNGDGALAQETTAGTSTAYWLDTTGGLPERLGATTGGSTSWYTRGWGQELSQEVGGTQTWYLADRLGSAFAWLSAQEQPGSSRLLNQSAVM
jgi:hypothetical protein